MGQEVVCLGSASRFTGVGEVVPATDEAGGCGGSVVVREGRVDNSTAFRSLVLVKPRAAKEVEMALIYLYLDDDKTGTGSIGRGKVDTGLVVRDVEPLDCGLRGRREGQDRTNRGLHDRFL